MDESRNLRERVVRFNFKKLASVAAESIGAARRIAVEKLPNGMFNKAYVRLRIMFDERWPRYLLPDAGFLHFTTIIEVTTMKFVAGQRLGQARAVRCAALSWKKPKTFLCGSLLRLPSRELSMRDISHWTDV
jgi:hypothetical protein